MGSSKESFPALEKSTTVLRGMRTSPGTVMSSACLLDIRKSSEVRSRQGLDPAGADGLREVGEVWVGTF